MRSNSNGQSQINLQRKEVRQMKDQIALNVEELEERIAPSALGNPGNNNPPLNNTNNPGNEGTGGQVSTGN
jgi:hypothetical protein